jgi:hypothetical protein
MFIRRNLGEEQLALFNNAVFSLDFCENCKRRE